jgi:hypothetical protein
MKKYLKRLLYILFLVVVWLAGFLLLGLVSFVSAEVSGVRYPEIVNSFLLFSILIMLSLYTRYWFKNWKNNVSD